MSTIKTPAQLVEEFKKSGEFDRLRRELLKEFRQSEGMPAFLARVEDIAKQKLASDPKLQFMPEANVTREIMQELERYPIVERAVSDVSSLSNPTFLAGVRDSVQKTLQEDRKAGGQGAPNGTSQVNGTGPKAAGQQDSDSESSAESMDLEDDESSD
ncbi:complex proteins associated with Set1p component shg1-domain-containing protein [Cubamyces lactineus]|nr:complex proteins associated with Set1p component shg1-domain-containing protein [Cubamyces lactineus]